MYSIPGYDAWKLRSPEDDPVYRVRGETECPNCGRMVREDLDGDYLCVPCSLYIEVE